MKTLQLVEVPWLVGRRINPNGLLPVDKTLQVCLLTVDHQDSRRRVDKYSVRHWRHITPYRWLPGAAASLHNFGTSKMFMNFH